MRCLIGAFTFLMIFGVISAEEKSAPIPAIDLVLSEFPKSKVTDYLTITDEKKLKEVVDGKEKLDKIKVDFTKQKVLIFAWSGSGGDQLTATGNDKEVNINYIRGLTKDLRGHTKAFVVSKDAKVNFGMGR